MPAALRGVSRESLVRVRARLDALVPADRPAEVIDRVGEQLFAVVDLLDGQPALRRALTDPSRVSADRAALGAALLAERVGDDVSGLVSVAVEQPWSRTRDLGDALEYLAVLVLVRDAERRGRLDAVEDELFAFGEAIRQSPRLAAAVSEPGAPVASRLRLGTDLLAGSTERASMTLAERAIAAPRAGSVADTLAEFARIAAELRERLVATVRTAAPLSDTNRERLRAALARQYGRDVHLNALIDPAVVGGIAVTVGHDLIDGTVHTRLTEARRRLAS